LGGFVPTSVRNWTLRAPTTSPTQYTVTVYSNCQQVELFLNDKSLGAKDKNKNDASRAWQVPFDAGALRAVGRNDGQEVASDELRTAGNASKIVLSVERDKVSPSWDDLSFVTATVVDDKGVTCPYATDLITFKISGPGVVAAVDNGDRLWHESFQASECKAFQGRAVAMIRASATSGQITVTASCPSLGGSSTTLEAVAAK
jgi:beta-galactosidase